MAEGLSDATLATLMTNDARSWESRGAVQEMFRGYSTLPGYEAAVPGTADVSARHERLSHSVHRQQSETLREAGPRL